MKIVVRTIVLPIYENCHLHIHWQNQRKRVFTEIRAKYIQIIGMSYIYFRTTKWLLSHGKRMFSEYLYWKCTQSL